MTGEGTPPLPPSSQDLVESLPGMKEYVTEEHVSEEVEENEEVSGDPTEVTDLPLPYRPHPCINFNGLILSDCK